MNKNDSKTNFGSFNGGTSWFLPHFNSNQPSEASDISASRPVMNNFHSQQYVPNTTPYLPFFEDSRSTSSSTHRPMNSYLTDARFRDSVNATPEGSICSHRSAASTLSIIKNDNLKYSQPCQQMTEKFQVLVNKANLIRKRFNPEERFQFDMENFIEPPWMLALKTPKAVGNPQIDVVFPRSQPASNALAPNTSLNEADLQPFEIKPLKRTSWQISSPKPKSSHQKTNSNWKPVPLEIKMVESPKPCSKVATAQPPVVNMTRTAHLRLVSVQQKLKNSAASSSKPGFSKPPSRLLQTQSQNIVQIEESGLSKSKKMPTTKTLASVKSRRSCQN